MNPIYFIGWWPRRFLAVLSLFLLPSCMFMEYNRAMEINAVNKEYAAGNITIKQRDQKIAAIRKSYAEYEAQWIANMKAQAARSQVAMHSQSNNQAGVYTYTPPPQYEYVYNQDPGPKPTHIPPPEVYVSNQEAGQKLTYVPPPYEYVYNQDPRPKQVQTPPPEIYVTTPRPERPQQQYVPDVPPRYVRREDMTDAEKKKFDEMYPKLPPQRIQADTTIGLKQGLERENAMRTQAPAPKNAQSSTSNNASQTISGAGQNGQDYFYGFDGKKYPVSDSLNRQMEQRGGALASGTQAGIDTLKEAGKVVASPSLWQRLKGAFGVSKNAPAALEGLKQNYKAVTDPSPMNTGLRGPELPKPAPR